MNKLYIIEDLENENKSAVGFVVAEKTGIHYAAQWNPVRIRELEDFIKEYETYKFEYKTGLDWIIRWGSSYKTLHNGDVFIIGYRHLQILSKKEFEDRYWKVGMEEKQDE
jgi:hypothetical protein